MRESTLPGMCGKCKINHATRYGVIHAADRSARTAMLCDTCKVREGESFVGVRLVTEGEQGQVEECEARFEGGPCRWEPGAPGSPDWCYYCERERPWVASGELAVSEKPIELEVSVRNHEGVTRKIFSSVKGEGVCE